MGKVIRKIPTRTGMIDPREVPFEHSVFKEYDIRLGAELQFRPGASVIREASIPSPPSHPTFENVTNL